MNAHSSAKQDSNDLSSCMLYLVFKAGQGISKSKRSKQAKAVGGKGDKIDDFLLELCKEDEKTYLCLRRVL